TKNIAVVDVRTYEERSQIPIPNSIHIPVDELELKLDDIKSFDVVYFFCRAGRRAEIATQLAISHGIKAITIPDSIYEIKQASDGV
ncbi:MAG: rhodanese-like domain-containing protein, partial [Proteobacteria bacterium]|nr:rhodanese-like domain-containing protein [Pseudomonadota bacterium]